MDKTTKNALIGVGIGGAIAVGLILYEKYKNQQNIQQTTTPSTTTTTEDVEILSVKVQ